VVGKNDGVVVALGKLLASVAKRVYIHSLNGIPEGEMGAGGGRRGGGSWGRGRWERKR